MTKHITFPFQIANDVDKSRSSLIYLGLLFFGYSLALYPINLWAQSNRTLEKSSNASTQAIFDGKTLTNWDGDQDYWRVENGAIVGEIRKGEQLTKNTWLVWTGGDLADFELNLQFRLTGLPAANSGIQFRCQVDNHDHVSGYQADLDMGAMWLGRIYDEHGRALLVERGSRVHILPDGSRQMESFASPNHYAVLFRENAWNDYRIIAVKNHVQVYINGTLFSELYDEEEKQLDLQGKLALQLHSGPETRIEFRDLTLRDLSQSESTLGSFKIQPQAQAESNDPGIIPKKVDGTEFNADFESGTLEGWVATGNSFTGQPVKVDGITDRWPDQVSNKQGDFFIGSFETSQDSGTGTLTSEYFLVSQPYASFLIGGGNTPTTRVDLLEKTEDGTERVFFSATGENREQMRRVSVDLRQQVSKPIAIRLVDDNRDGWGHLNFDDFRLHQQPPTPVSNSSEWRTIRNPVLQHLVPNPIVRQDDPSLGTLDKMFVPDGFSIDTIAMEPRLHQPMAFTFDSRGRLWVVEGYCYPQKRPEGEGLDRIVIFADKDGDGSFEDRKVFQEGLNLVSGLEVGHGGVWVGAAPELLFIPDRDHDDVPDAAPKVLLDGFGYADTHETMNSFLWGPDGWLYGNQGVFNTSMIGKPGAIDADRLALSAGVWRYHPTQHRFEVFAYGGSNQWGLDYDDMGQIFMTHCRSFWGRGGTTHVMQGGHYWNQVNAGYAPFISNQPMSGRPWMQNFLLASARYDHGEGGAGKPGTNDVYGGHSHVGTMIYLGDNWPSQYRNHLFTHNLHGHQLNHQINLREAGGYNTVHAGYDVLFCADQQYIGVDLQVGPDGAVYFSDWYDPRHCHNPNAEQWDRGNGRLYRMKYDSTWKPVQVDYSRATDDQLVEAQRHPNDWHVRMARLELADRATSRSIQSSAVTRLKELAMKHPDEARRLRAIWTLHSIGSLTSDLYKVLWKDPSEYVRGWAIQLSTESMRAGTALNDDQAATVAAITQLAEKEQSLFVCRYLASALQRLPSKHCWNLANLLANRPDLDSDRDLPILIWCGIGPRVLGNVEQAMAMADGCSSSQLRDYIYWYAAANSGQARQEMLLRWNQLQDDRKIWLLETLEFAVRDQRNLGAPTAWNDISAKLYSSESIRLREIAITIGAAFGDTSAYDRLRQKVESGQLSVQSLQHTLRMLASDPSPANLPIYLKLLDNDSINAQVIPMLSRYDQEIVADRLLDRIPTWTGSQNSAAKEVLCSRVAWANKMLDQIQQGKLDKSQLTAYFARQMSTLGDAKLMERLTKEWGTLSSGDSERKKEIVDLTTSYKTAPLWAYSAEAGAEHFKKLCAQCHLPSDQVEALAPKLAGSGAKGAEYLVENIIDPNAVIGRDYQAKIFVTDEGRVITGLIEKETDSSYTIRTLNESTTLAKSEIEQVKTSPNSFMPVDLLKTLNEREKIELLKYLMAQ